MLQNGGDLAKRADLSGQSTLSFFNNFYKVDGVWNETLPTSTVFFANGRLAMYFGTYKEVFNIKKQNPGLHFGVVPLPQLPKNNQSIPSISYASYWVNGVSNKSGNVTAAWDFLKFMSSVNSLQELYKNEIKTRGYGNLYPRVDMQSQLLSDPIAGAFIFQGSFARSWYLHANTNDGVTGINAQIAKPYSDAIGLVNLNSTSDKALQDAQNSV